MTGTLTGSRDGARASAREYIDSGRFLAEIGSRVAVRSESQLLPASLPCLHQYLDEQMTPAFKAMGFSCRTFDNPLPNQGPVLLATRIEDPALPTVLGYGHGDVIRGLDEQWSKGKGPWVVSLEGDKLYGRGTADNKGQHTLNMAAMAAVIAERGGKLGFNAKFMIETGEEAGSKGLMQLVRANTQAFAADVLIGSDGPRVTPLRATMALGCRGALNFDLVCDLRSGGHHSGNWGGLLANPGLILAHALATIVSPEGRLQIKEWLPPPISNSVREALADIEIDPGEGGPKVDAWWGEKGLTAAEKVFAGNAFNVLAYSTGNPGRPVNAVPPKAVAHCQLRYVAGTDIDAILPALRRHLDANGFGLVTILPPPETNDGGFGASRTDPEHPWALWCRRAIEATTGEKPAIVTSTGGSICNDVFTEALGIPTIWIPHSYASCSQHAPDEHLLMPVVKSAIDIMAGLYWDLGEGKTPPRGK